MPAPGSYTIDAVTDKDTKGAWTLVADSGTTKYMLLDQLSEYELVHNGHQNDGTTADLNNCKIAVSIDANTTPVPAFTAGSGQFSLPAGSSRTIRKTTNLAILSAAGSPTVSLFFIKKNNGMDQ